MRTSANVSAQLGLKQLSLAGSASFSQVMAIILQVARSETSGTTQLLEPFITYSDANHGGNLDNRKSTGGYVMKIGSEVVSWTSKLQPLVALSITEGESECLH